MKLIELDHWQRKGNVNKTFLVDLDFFHQISNSIESCLYFCGIFVNSSTKSCVNRVYTERFCGRSIEILYWNQQKNANAFAWCKQPLKDVAFAFCKRSMWRDLKRSGWRLTVPLSAFLPFLYWRSYRFFYRRSYHFYIGVLTVSFIGTLTVSYWRSYRFLLAFLLFLYWRSYRFLLAFLPFLYWRSYHFFIGVLTVSLLAFLLFLYRRSYRFYISVLTVCLSAFLASCFSCWRLWPARCMVTGSCGLNSGLG